MYVEEMKGHVKEKFLEENIILCGRFSDFSRLF
jgi:hypothetical protein